MAISVQLELIAVLRDYGFGDGQLQCDRPIAVTRPSVPIRRGNYTLTEWPLFANHPNWIAGERRKALKTGDYAVEEMEGSLCLERKSLADIVACTVTDRERFLASCARLARFRWKAILIEATFEDIKGGFEPFDIPSDVHPNAVVGTLDAIEAKFGIAA